MGVRYWGPCIFSLPNPQIAPNLLQSHRSIQPQPCRFDLAEDVEHLFVVGIQVWYGRLLIIVLAPGLHQLTTEIEIALQRVRRRFQILTIIMEQSAFLP